MDTKHLAPGTARAPSSGNFRWWLGVIGILVVATGLFIALTGRIVPPATASRRTTGPHTDTLVQKKITGDDIPRIVPLDMSNMDAASQGVMNYIRVHETIPDYVILSLFKRHRYAPD